MADKEEQEDILEYNEFETITFEDNRTIITKYNENEERLSKAELNQCAEEIFPDHWIVENRELIDSIYKVLDDLLHYADFGQYVTHSTFVDYVDFVHYYDTIDTCEWNQDVVNEFEIKFKSKRKPKYKRWVQCNLNDLYQMWNILKLDYADFIGGFEIFTEFLYEYS